MLSVASSLSFLLPVRGNGVPAQLETHKMESFNDQR